MTYNKRQMVVLVASIIAIIATLLNIKIGMTLTGLYISIFAILMLLIVVFATLMNKKLES